MVDMLDQGAAWLERMRQSHLSRTVLYQRGEQSVEVQATVGHTVFRIDDEFGGQVRIEQRDYLIGVEDLVLGGDEVQPQRGDRIGEIRNGQTETYEVMGPGGNEPDWRYSDPSHRAFRVHVKHVTTGEA